MNLDGYLLCIIATTLLASVLTAILPEGKTTGVVKGVTKLVCLLSILSPIPQFLQKQSFFDLFKEENTQKTWEDFSQSVIPTDESFIKYVSNMRMRLLEEELSTAIRSKFGVICAVKLDGEIDEETAVITTKTVMITFFSRVTDEEKQTIKQYLEKQNLNEVQFE